MKEIKKPKNIKEFLQTLDEKSKNFVKNILSNNQNGINGENNLDKKK